MGGAVASSEYAAPRGLVWSSPRYRELTLVFGGYLLVAALFHAAGLNLFHRLLGGGDGFTFGLPSMLFATHVSPWNPYVQLGQYSFANTQFQPFYPPALAIMMLFPGPFGYNLFILFHYAFAGLFFYLFAKNLPLGAYASLVGGLLFMLSGFLSAHKGHQAMLSATVWLPLMLFFMDRYVARRHLKELASASLAFAMSVLAGFPQVTLFSILVAATYALYRFRADARNAWDAMLRWLFAMGTVGILSLLLSSFQLFAVVEALPQMTREKLTYGAFSEDYLPIYHLLTFFIPNVMGGFFHIRTYSPEINVVEVYPYMGLLPLALVYVAFRCRRRESRDAVFWGSLGAVALIVSLGQLTPLNSVLFRVPIYNLFRAPARHLMEVNFAIAVLAAIALDIVVRPNISQSRQLARSLIEAATVLGVAFALVLGISQLLRGLVDWLPALPLSGIDEVAVSPILKFGAAKALLLQNLSPTSPTILYPCLFAALSIAILKILATGRFNRVVLAALPVVLVADVYLAYSSLYANPDTSNLGHPEYRAETAFLSAQKFDKELYRIFPVNQGLIYTYPLLNMTYGWSAVNDYGPMWLKRYVVMTDFASNGAMPPQNLSNPNVLAVAGARYLIANERNYVERIRAAEVVRPVKYEPLLFNPGVMFDHATAEGNGRYLLQSPDGTVVSLLQSEIPLRKSTSYQITFNMRAPAGLSKPLIVNLYNGNAGYDDFRQYKVYMQAPKESIRQSAVIDSGPHAPERAFVRIYTQSAYPVEINDIGVGVATEPIGVPTAPENKAYHEIYSGVDGTMVFENTRALPRFRFVKTLRPCKDEFEARRILDSDPAFDAANEALVEGLPEKVTLTPGEILSRRLNNNQMQWSVKTGDRSFFVVADSWFPGWRATVDHKETLIQIVNGFLRGIMIEGAGVHEVEMSYHPWSVTAGVCATLLGLALIGIMYWRGGDL